MNHQTKIKICGITNFEDALAAIEIGADYLGFNCYTGSKRFINPTGIKGIIDRLNASRIKQANNLQKCQYVGVFVNESKDAILNIVNLSGLQVVQLHGDESIKTAQEIANYVNKPIIKAFRVKNKNVLRQIEKYANFSTGSIERLAPQFLLDAYDSDHYGGSGKVFDWDLALTTNPLGQLFLAGGLTPDNVQEAVNKVNPYAVDTASGVEISAGKKDLKLVKQFIDQVKSSKNN